MAEQEQDGDLSLSEVIEAVTVFCVKEEQIRPLLFYIFGLWAYTFLAFGVRSWLAVRREYLTQKYVEERKQLEGEILVKKRENMVREQGTQRKGGKRDRSKSRTR